jgi:hypothetical protein
MRFLFSAKTVFLTCKCLFSKEQSIPYHNPAYIGYKENLVSFPVVFFLDSPKGEQGGKNKCPLPKDIDGQNDFRVFHFLKG